MSKKLLHNGYKNKAERRCRYCPHPSGGAERHEVFGGNPNRQISIREGFQVDVCRMHHQELQDNITPWAQKENLRLRQYFERKWLDERMTEGQTEAEAVRGWMSLIGKNYLDEIMPE